MAHSWATFKPVARADDGRAADNGPLLTGQQVDEVLIVVVVVVVVVCCSSCVLREWIFEVQEEEK